MTATAVMISLPVSTARWVAHRAAGREGPGDLDRRSAGPARGHKTSHRGYEGTPDTSDPSALGALDLLLDVKLLAARRAELVGIVRAALDRPPNDLEAASRQRQSEVEAGRAVADLASDVEELSVNGVNSAVMVRSVRTRMNRRNLEPIEQAGVETRFDRSRHQPIGPSIPDV